MGSAEVEATVAKVLMASARREWRRMASIAARVRRMVSRAAATAVEAEKSRSSEAARPKERVRSRMGAGVWNGSKDCSWA